MGEVEPRQPVENLAAEQHGPTRTAIVSEARSPSVGGAGPWGQMLAVAGATLLLLALWLAPDLSPRLDQSNAFQQAQGRITRLLPASTNPAQPGAEVLVLSGPDAGTVVSVAVGGPSGSTDLPAYRVGDEVILSGSPGPDGTFYVIGDRMRGPALGALLALFAVAVLVVGGWRGLRSLLALALTIGVVLKLVVPLLLRGWDPVLLAVGTATAVTIVTLLLTEGWRKTTLAAVLGTSFALALTAGLALIFNDLADFTQFQASEEAAFVARSLGSSFDVSGLLLAAIIFGALGVLDDVTVTQAATVAELKAANPNAGRRWLIKSAMNIGRSHIAATVNTLVLAYLGASLPLLLLFAVGQQSALLTASSEFVAVEIVRGLVGSIGIVAAVPLTTLVAAMLVGEREADAPDGVA